MNIELDEQKISDVATEAAKAVREELAKRLKRAAKAMSTEDLIAANVAGTLLEQKQEPQPAKPDALN